MTPPRNALEVNFYHRNLGCASGARRLKLLAALALVALLLCVFWSFRGWMSAGQLVAEREQLVALADNNPGHVVALGAQLSEQKSAAATLDKVVALSEQLQRLRDTFGAMGGNDNSLPAAEYMKALSDSSVENVWLESIEFEQTSRFTLSGWTTNGQQLPVLMRAIASNETFGGYRVGMLDLSRGENNPANVDAIHFELEGRAKP